jgi:hypothetical protein
MFKHSNLGGSEQSLINNIAYKLVSQELDALQSSISESSTGYGQAQIRPGSVLN